MKYDYFGERSALFNDFRSATVVANRGVTCWILQKSDFLSILDEGVRVHMKKRIELQNDRIKLSELMLVTFLSRSGFGTLFLAKSNENGTL
jgi:CRP-like cAMP-binding protein